MAVLLLIIKKNHLEALLMRLCRAFRLYRSKSPCGWIHRTKRQNMKQIEFDLQLSGEQAPDIRSKHAHHFIPGKH